MTSKTNSSISKFVTILLIFILVFTSSGCIEDEKEREPETPKEPDPENEYEYPPIDIKVTVEDMGTFFKICVIKGNDWGIFALSDVNIKLFSSDDKQQFNLSFDYKNNNYILTDRSLIYVFPSDPDKDVHENPTTGDGAAVDKGSLDNPEVWEGCYLAFVDAPEDVKFFYGDSIWVYKDWDGDDVDDVSENHYLILECGNEMFLRINLSYIDKPYEKWADSLTIKNTNNYWQIELLNRINISFNTTETSLQIYSKYGVGKLDRYTFFYDGWEVPKRFEIGNSTYHVTDYDIWGVKTPYENSTNGTGEQINYNSFDHPERWECCIFVYVDHQSDECINAGDQFWLFKDWDDDNLDDVVLTDVLWIFDRDNHDMVVKIIS